MIELAARQRPHDGSAGWRRPLQLPPDLIILCSLLIITVPLFALITWQSEYTHTWTRHFSVPIVLCELAIVVLAIATRIDFDAAIRSLRLPTKAGAIVWFAVSAWASLYVAQPGRGANYLFLTSALQAVFALVIWWKLKTDWSGYGQHMLRAVAIGMLIYAAMVATTIVSMRGTSFDLLLVGMGVSNVRQLAFYGLTLSGIASGFLAFSERRATLFWLPMLIGGYWFTIWCGSRAGFGAMVGALTLVAMLVPRGRRVRQAALSILAIALAIGLSYAVVPSPQYGFGSISNRTLVSTDLAQFSSNRTAIWADTWGHILERPLAGHGEGQFRSVVKSALGVFNHPHNSPLQMLFQWGALGTLALLAMLWSTMRSGLERFRTMPGQAVAALGSLSGLAAMSLLDGSAYYVFPVMMMIMSLTIIAAALETGPGKTPATAQ